jgi:HK97 family phage portal protein
LGILNRIVSSIEVLTAEEPVGLGLHAQSGSSTLSNPDPWLREAFGARSTASGKAVTPHSAMQVATVYGCIRVLAESTAQLPLTLMRMTKDGGAEPATDHPLHQVLRSLFNDEVTAQDGVELGMNHLCLRGVAFTQVVRDQLGRPVQLWPLHPDGVHMRRNAVSALVYDYFPPGGGSKETFEKDEVWRTIGLSFDGVTGLSPISYARESIGLALATEEHGARLFVNGAQVSMSLTAPDSLTDEQYERLKEQLQQYQGSRNAHKTLVLENGMKPEKLSMTSVDSQFLESRRFQLEEICRIFRVPPHKVQELARSTFNNIEHLSIDFVNSSLRPWLRRFELTGFRDLLQPSERKRYFLRFDVDSILQGDSQAQANVDSLLIASRVISPNEARRKRGLNPYGGGDKYENPNTTAGQKQPGNTVPDTSKG